MQTGEMGSAFLPGADGNLCRGILSHILLDLVTSFGTMIWSPLQWSRPAWDLIFIVDFTLTAIFLVPQLLAWCTPIPKSEGRAVGMWWCSCRPISHRQIGEVVGAPISVESFWAPLLFLPWSSSCPHSAVGA